MGNGALSQTNVHELLKYFIDTAKQGLCSAALSYQAIVASRWKLHFILTTGALAELKNTASLKVQGIAQDLQSDLKNYAKSAVELNIQGLVAKKDTELSSCVNLVKLVS